MFGQVNLHSSLVDEQLSRDGGVIASRLSFAQPSERVYPGALQPQLLWNRFPRAGNDLRPGTEIIVWDQLKAGGAGRSSDDAKIPVR
jgi:hypothetical protein